MESILMIFGADKTQFLTSLSTLDIEITGASQILMAAF
jgi:hypothetical protein